MEFVHYGYGPKNAAAQPIDTKAMPPGLNSGREDCGTTTSATERRACTRYPIKLSAWYESQGRHSRHSGEAITTNLSISGICLLPDSELEIGSRIRVCIRWPVAPEAASLELVGAGTVIRKDWSGIGVKLERKPIFQFRRAEGDEEPVNLETPGQQDDDEGSVAQSVAPDTPALPPDRSSEVQRQGPLAIHDTAEGLISTTVRRNGDRWLGHCWGGRHDYSCEGNDASEARSGVDAFFHTMYPDHVCSPRCYVAPIDDDESAPSLTA